MFIHPSFPFASRSLWTSGLPESPPDSSLEPFTTYEYIVRGWNRFGKASSDGAVVTTSEEKPWGVAPPRWSLLGDREDVFQLFWQPPARPNGTKGAG